MLISGGNFHPMQAVVKASVWNYQSSDDCEVLGSLEEDNVVGMHTSSIGLLDVMCTSLIDRLAMPTTRASHLNSSNKNQTEINLATSTVSKKWLHKL